MNKNALGNITLLSVYSIVYTLLFVFPAFSMSSLGSSDQIGSNIIAHQPIPVRWATGAEKLPLKITALPQKTQKHDAIELTSLKNEAESFQISVGEGLSSSARIKKIDFSSLNHSTNNYQIKNKNIEIKLVGYVKDLRRNLEWPDVLFPAREFQDLKDGYNYTLWITIYVTSDAPAGNYKGIVQLKVEDENKHYNLKIPVKLAVYDYTLPKDIRVNTQLFSIVMSSVDLWYGFPNEEDKIKFQVEKVFPRLIKNKVSPSMMVPDFYRLYEDRKKQNDEDPVGPDYLEKWGKYWRNQGLYLNNIPVPKRIDMDKIRKTMSNVYKIILEEQWEDHIYVRLPFDEATTGNKAKRNIQFAEMIKQVAPRLKKHQTLGGGLKRIKNPVKNILQPYSNYVDIWSSVPGHYLGNDQLSKTLYSWLKKHNTDYGSELSWYIHHNVPTGNSYKKAYSAIDLRGFFWRMYQENVHMCTLWSMTNWDREVKKHKNRNPKRLSRGFEITPSTSLGIGNGLLLYPSNSTNEMILDSVRLQIIRDGIEDYQYFYEVQKYWNENKNPEAKILLTEIKNIKPTFIRFGTTVDTSPNQIQDIRQRISIFLSKNRKK